MERCKCSGKVHLDIKAITPPIEHAEGPYWNYARQELYFVDTFKPTVYRWKLRDSSLALQSLPGKSVGIVVPIKGEKNKFIVAGDRTFSVLSWDMETNNTGVLEEVSRVEEDKPDNQFNDGKVDSSGRLWIGTLKRKHDLSVENNGGNLYIVTNETLKRPFLKKTGLSISNGIAWDSANKEMYFIDSETRKIFVYDFYKLTGNIGNERVLFDLEKYPFLQGIPDGMTIDTDNNLWVALYGGQAVLKINSKTGELLQVIKLPATYVTSVAFGGQCMATLFVTTSKLKLTKEMAEDEPEAGCVFAVKGLKAHGYPPYEFIM